MNFNKAAVSKFMMNQIKNHLEPLTNEINCTSLAEEAANKFNLFIDDTDFEIPEEVFDLAVIAAENFKK